MLYKIRDSAPISVLKSIYFNIFNSHLAYGLPVWGNAHCKYLEKITKLQKKAIRAITFSNFTAHTKPLLKDLKILNVKDLLYQQTASMMWDLENNLLPPSLSSYFVKTNQIHNHNTRQVSSGKYFIKKTLTTQYGINSFQVQGALVLNKLKDLDIYNNATSKKQFLNNLKIKLLNEY